MRTNSAFSTKNIIIMRVLADQTGVQTPDADYVGGRIVDNNTIVDEAINGDMIEFFQKLLDLAGLTANGLPDNTSNGHQTLTALEAVVRNFDATQTEKGVQENATDTEAKSFESASKTISPATLGAVRANLLTKIIDIGVWDMNATANVNVSHGISDISKIRQIEVMIMSDNSKPIPFLAPGYGGFFVDPLNSTIINIGRSSGELFATDSNFNGDISNRGYITINYEVNVIP